MYKEAELSDEEKKEALRHDKSYQEKGRAFILPPCDWEKFDLTERPSHGYVYSVKCLGDIRGKKVLDLGCGTGWLSVILAKRGANVEAIDISTEAIRIAVEMAKVNQVAEKINFKVGSIYELDYPSDYFDFVIGQAILHHIRDKTKLAEQLFRILKLGGEAVFFEAFGESKILEKIRLLIPVPIDEEDETHWGEKIKYQDLATFKRLFTVNYLEFHLFSRLDRVISYKPIVSFLGWLDLILLRYLFFLRKYSRTIVIELIKPGT